MSEVFYEREGAVFRRRDGQPLEIFGQQSGKFFPYKGDCYSVQNETEVTLDEVRPYMDVPPVDYPEAQPA